MDERSQLDENVLKGLFANGFMGVEVPEQYGGPGASLFDVVIIVEELAKVDPAVAVMCDVQNTLIVPLLLKNGSEMQKEKYLKHTHDDWVLSKINLSL
ncbi:unnamed protein product [Gongylonema pulchrum]|uniref:Acyl-CoA_dh_N domain-containing protein n=1 Tax=Gongylonema pulchrum TaxID=637853 RepID=A0A183DG71_9BILA|nr:unnamed protein product [Gongylonema pulchrum]